MVNIFLLLLLLLMLQLPCLLLLLILLLAADAVAVAATAAEAMRVDTWPPPHVALLPTRAAGSTSTAATSTWWCSCCWYYFCCCYKYGVLPYWRIYSRGLMAAHAYLVRPLGRTFVLLPPQLDVALADTTSAAAISTVFCHTGGFIADVLPL